MADLSVVDICNLALIKIGAKPLVSLSDDNKAARACTKIYAMLRDDMLRMFPWNFAIKRVELAQSSTAPAFGYTYAYTLPGDCLRPLRLHDSTTVYRIESTGLLTNAVSAKLVYIARITDTTTFDNQFINLLACRLALELAYNLSNDSALVNFLRETYSETVKLTQNSDVTEDTSLFLEASTLGDSDYLSIFDNALIRIGASQVQSVSDDAKIAKMCNRMVASIRDDLLRSHPWNFAITRATLTADMTTPSFEFGYQFTLPSNCLRLIKLYGTNANYRVEGRKILSDASTLNIIYVKQVTDPDDFDANFTKCLTLKLASELALNVLPEKPNIGMAIAQEFDRLYKRAKMADAQEDGAYMLETDTLINSRFGFEDIPYLALPE